MFSVFRAMKLVPVNRSAANSTSALVFQHNKQFLHKRICSSTFWARSSLTNTSRSLATLPGKETVSGKSSTMDSYVLTYLVNSCGMSAEVAVSVAQKLSFAGPEKPDLVLNLLRSQGFSKSQIVRIVRQRPVLLLAKVKTLVPKFEFFQSIGVPRDELARILSYNSTLLTRSLENQIIPCYNFLKSVVESDKKVVAALKRSSWIFLYDYGKNILPNITLLRETGVPKSNIALLLTHFPEALTENRSLFKGIVFKVKEMGFDSSKSIFVLAIHALSGHNKAIWDRSYEAYRKWGWSKDEILSAFRKHPHCMILSEKKITKALNFLVNGAGWNYQSVVACPSLLFFNLEKRIIPRCSVIQVLLSKGLVIKHVSLSYVLLPPEEQFLDRFVYRFKEEAPLLLDVCQGKMKAAEL